MDCSTADVLIKTGTCKQPVTHGPNLSARHTDWQLPHLLGLTGFHTDRQADRLAVTSFTRTDRLPHQTDRQSDRHSNGPVVIATVTEHQPVDRQ